MPDYSIDMPDLFLRVQKWHYSKDRRDIRDLETLVDNLLIEASDTRLLKLLLYSLRLSKDEISRAVESFFNDDSIRHPPKGGDDLHFAGPVFFAATELFGGYYRNMTQVANLVMPLLNADIRAAAAELAVLLKEEIQRQILGSTPIPVLNCCDLFSISAQDLFWRSD